MIKVKRITSVSSQTLASLNALLLQWSTNGYQMKMSYLKALVKKSHVMAVYDDKKIVGTATLIPLYKLSGLKGSVEHVLIDQKYRGKGLGETLMTELIVQAKKLKMESLFLTCEPEREGANALYKKIGFIKKETNYYQLHVR